MYQRRKRIGQTSRQRSSRTLVGALLFALALAGCGDGASGPTVHRDAIAFASNRDGNDEIYVMEADGSRPVRLTRNTHTDTYPAWSPDGHRIAFISERDSVPGRPRFGQLYLMNADGSGLRRLTVPEAGPVHYVPAWSPDGRQLAYSCKRGDFFAICVADADGTSERQITNDAWDDSWPAWSPDGAHLAIESNRDGYSQIYVLKADGTGGRLLTADLLYQNNMGPAWSPDAALISFTGGYGDVYVIAASGDSPPRRLTAETWTEGPPTWSPDGSLLAFHRFTGNIMDGVSASTCDIFVVRSSDGQGERNVTNHPACDWAPAWRPAR